MRAVLLDSRAPSSSPRVPVGRCKDVVVSGLDGSDLLVLVFSPMGEVSIRENGRLSIPKGTFYVVAHHREASGSGVSVDLE